MGFLLRKNESEEPVQVFPVGGGSMWCGFSLCMVDDGWRYGLA